MKKILRLVTAGLLMTTLIACGKSDEQKSQERAQDLTTQHNELLLEIQAAGMPSSSWSDTDLDSCETKLNRLESLGNQLRAANGKDRVIITGGDTSEFISVRRTAISEARSAKKKNASTDQLLSEYNALVRELNASGTPRSNWSDTELDSYETKLSRLEALRSQLLGRDGIKETGLGNTTEYIRERREDLREARADKKNGGKKAKLKLLQNSMFEKTEKIQRMGIPSQSWSDERLKEYRDLCTQVVADADAQIEMINQDDTIVPNSRIYLTILAPVRSSALQLITGVDKIRAEKARRAI